MNKMKYFCILIFVFALNTTGVGQNLENIGEEKAVDLSGSITIGAGFYDTNLGYNRQDPFAYRISGNPVLSLYGVRIPFRFTYANQQFNSSHPFQNYGISPSYKWIKLHMGYSSMSFSPYTLNQHTFLGAGVELTPGNFRFGFMYGQLQNKIKTGAFQNLESPSFQRNAYGFKIGYGTASNYVDLIFFKAKDDTTSVSQNKQIQLLPKENLVVGIQSRQKITKWFTWEIDVSSSAFTRSMFSQALGTNDLPIPDGLNNLYQPRLSSRMNYAGHTSANFNFGKFRIKGKYRRIDPEYRSLGTYFLNNDLEQYTINPALNLMNGRLNISGSYGIQQDNIRDHKAYTTQRQIGSVNMNLNTKGAFGINAQYSNYTIDQQQALLQLNDTTKIARVSSNYSIAPRLLYRKGQTTHQVTMFLSGQILNDANQFTSDFTETQSYNGNISYNYRSQKTTINYNAGINSVLLQTFSGDIFRYGLTGGIGKSFLQNNLVAKLRGVYNRQQFEGEDAGYVLTGALSVNYKLHQNHRLSANIRLTKNETQNQSFSENIAGLEYVFRF